MATRTMNSRTSQVISLHTVNIEVCYIYQNTHLKRELNYIFVLLFPCKPLLDLYLQKRKSVHYNEFPCPVSISMYNTVEHDTKVTANYNKQVAPLLYTPRQRLASPTVEPNP